ncbi:DUF6082 family protein [Streptomyces sp. NPDC048650]|uniref:DUF6082 family protein n=1 Tax=Streptomyces sp. NPDC048650 TaxID=3365583 RepID=UPI003712C631
MKFKYVAVAALAAVGAVQIVQRERHQRQRNEVTVAHIQLNRLTHLTAHPDLAALWAPPGVGTEEYVKLLDANHQICALSLRHKLGITRGKQLRFVAEKVMEREIGRRYWKRFGSFRAEEAAGDKPSEEFTEAMHDAYLAHPEIQPAGV